MKSNTKKKINLNISKNRNSRPYASSEYFMRLIWNIISPLFKYSPRHLYFWRNFLLRLLGAKIGKKVHIYPSVEILLPWKLELGDEISIGDKVIIYNLGLITIGDRSTISQRVHLCGGSHDYTDQSMRLIRSTIQIGSETWICADAFIGPDLIIGDGSIVGAASVVTKNIPPWQVFGGNPARYIKKRILKGNK